MPHRFVVAVTLTSLLTAQQAEPPGQKPAPAVAAEAAKERAPFVFEAGEVPLRMLLDRCSVYLQRNILLDDQELTGQQRQGGRNAPAPAGNAEDGPMVRLQLPVVTDRDGCEEILSSLLWTHGLVMVPLDEQRGVYEVLSTAGQRQMEIFTRAPLRTPEQVLARPMLRQVVTAVLHLEHLDATIATNQLRPFYGGSNRAGTTLIVGNVGNSKAILLNGPQNTVADALRLLRIADVPPTEPAPDLAQTVDGLRQQQAALQQRIAALEALLKEQGEAAKGDGKRKNG